MPLALQNQCMLVFLLTQCNLGLNLKDVQGCSRDEVASTSIRCLYGLLHHLQYSRNVNNWITKITEVCLPEQAVSPWDGIYRKIPAELKNSWVFNNLCFSAGKKHITNMGLGEQEFIAESQECSPEYINHYSFSLLSGIPLFLNWEDALGSQHLYCWQPSGHSAAGEH